MKVAVVLFNLGGPDGPKAVRPFLFNLFRDPAIIQLPGPARYALAALISTTRAKASRANYQLMGGGSPLLPGTNAQAFVLQEMLKAEGLEARTFVAMRYWKPFTDEVAAQVDRFDPDEIILLPLYPQYSTTTTGSSLTEWGRVYKGRGRSRAVCCYPNAPGLVDAHVDAIRKVWREAGDPPGDVRLLFSAHGLPQQVVDAGDPYAAQITATAQAIAARLPEFPDWKVCYQSRVGRLKWLGPSTVEALHQAAADGKGVLICPIAFVSEHIETLVELDVEYAELAKDLGIHTYLRARTPETDRGFVAELARAVTGALGRSGTAPHGPWRCPAAHGKCRCRAGESAA